MLWLASYPRSGNTFFRNVLYEVYGLSSSTFHLETDYPVDPGYATYPIVKTHLLPSQLAPSDASIPAVYLIRDGRDCAVSLARYRKELIDPTSDYETNLREAIEAKSGTHFGGWSENVRQWSKRASLIIRFEDLIVDPIGCVEQLRSLIDLPRPRIERLPSFQDLRSRDFKYGSGVEHGFKEEERQQWRQGKFRRGKTGAWRDEMPHPHQLLFLTRHGRELVRWGYPVPRSENSPSMPTVGVPLTTGRSAATDDFSCQEHKRPGSHPLPIACTHNHDTISRPRRILIDATKLLDSRLDGIKRYLLGLLVALDTVAEERVPEWDIDVALGSYGFYPLRAIADSLRGRGLSRRQIPRVLRTELSNPTLAAKMRPENHHLAGWRRMELQVQFQYSRLARSVVKRLCELKTKLRQREKYDLLHLTLPNTWSYYRWFDAPMLVTMHDLSHISRPEHQKNSNIVTLAEGIEFSEHRRAAYIAVSAATKQQMTTDLGIAPERIEVVSNGICHTHFRPIVDRKKLARVRQHYGISETPFLLCLSTIEPRKNLLNVVRAFEKLMIDFPDTSAQLILAGSHGWGDHSELHEIIERSPHIHAVGFVDDDDLPALYSAASGFCYVSHYEGFGLPLLEAMACGSPTIYSNNSSMPEVSGDTGLSVDSTNVPGIMEQMRKLLSDESLRRDLSERAVMRSLTYDWRLVAEQMLACYELAIQGDERSAGPSHENEQHAAA